MASARLWARALNIPGSGGGVSAAQAVLMSVDDRSLNVQQREAGNG